jgi:hypothetical protein
MDAFTISSNHYSVDQQAADALDYLRLNDVPAYVSIMADFGESIVWSGGWFDHEAMGVDPEWGSWLVDAIEDRSAVVWVDGEPWSSYPADECPEPGCTNDADEDFGGWCEDHEPRTEPRPGESLADELRMAENVLHRSGDDN